MTENRIGLCETCVNYVPHFKLCADRIRHQFALDESPSKHECARDYRKADKYHPTKQLSTFQVDAIERTHYEIEFDNDGWIADVHVKGMEKVPLEMPIPQLPIALALYTDRYGEHRYAPTCGKAILIAHEQSRPSMTRVLKRWGWSGLPPKEPAIFKSPIHATLAVLVREMEINKTSGQMVLTADVTDEFVQFWKKMGYEGGTENIDGLQISWAGYRRGKYQNHLFVQPGIPSDVRKKLANLIELTDRGETRFLERIPLDTHCILCGYDYRTFVKPDVCTWCKMITYQVSFY